MVVHKLFGVCALALLAPSAAQSAGLTEPPDCVASCTGPQPADCAELEAFFTDGCGATCSAGVQQVYTGSSKYACHNEEPECLSGCSMQMKDITDCSDAASQMASGCADACELELLSSLYTVVCEGYVFPSDTEEEGDDDGGSSDWRPEQHSTEHSMEWSGVTRYWDLHVPEGLAAKAPLIISMHGAASNSGELAAYAGWSEIADEAGAILVRPNGIRGTWSEGASMCSEYTDEETGERVVDKRDDVGFLRALIAQLAAEHPVDVTRIYVSGHSCGCMMAHRMLIDASDIVAAMACTAGHLVPWQGAIYNSKHTPYHPRPVMVIHGTEDGTVPYAGREQFVPDYYVAGAVRNMETMAEMNGCTDSAPARTWENDDGTEYQLTYENCEDNAKVSLLTVVFGHLPYKIAGLDIDPTAMAWEFMKDHTAPDAACHVTNTCIAEVESAAHVQAKMSVTALSFLVLCALYLTCGAYEL